MENLEAVEMVSAPKAAAMLGTTRLRVLMLIKEGMLEGTQEGGEWFVDRASLERFEGNGSDATAQRSCRTSCGGCAGQRH